MAVRRIGVVLLVAVAATGCVARTDIVPGQAAPITATGSTGPAPSQAPSPAGPTSSPASPTSTPTPTPVPVPTTFRNVSMTGFGLSITFPVPDAWTVSRSQTTELSRTDVKVGDDILLRVDLTAHGTGTARAAAEANEAAIRPGRPNYRRLGITAVPGVGDEAVDWTFSYDEDGTPARVIDRLIRSGTGRVAVYLRVPAESYGRLLPVWERTTRDLTIRAS